MTDNKPTYEEVVAYAKSEGLIGKVDTVKFYDFYDRQNFLYKGAIMDWKKKLHEWASSQRVKVMQSAKEAEAIRAMGKKIDTHQLDTIQNILKGMALA